MDFQKHLIHHIGPFSHRVGREEIQAASERLQEQCGQPSFTGFTRGEGRGKRIKKKPTFFEAHSEL